MLEQEDESLVPVYIRSATEPIAEVAVSRLKAEREPLES